MRSTSLVSAFVYDQVYPTCQCIGLPSSVPHLSVHSSIIKCTSLVSALVHHQVYLTCQCIGVPSGVPHCQCIVVPSRVPHLSVHWCATINAPSIRCLREAWFGLKLSLTSATKSSPRTFHALTAIIIITDRSFVNHQPKNTKQNNSVSTPWSSKI